MTLVVVNARSLHFMSTVSAEQPNRLRARRPHGRDAGIQHAAHRGGVFQRDLIVISCRRESNLRPICELSALHFLLNSLFNDSQDFYS